MAKVVLTFEDVPTTADNDAEIGVRLSFTTDRSDDAALGLDIVPATPAMLFGLTTMRIYEQHVLENMIGFVCQDIMRGAKLTPAEIADAEAAGKKAANER